MFRVESREAFISLYGNLEMTFQAHMTLMANQIRTWCNMVVKLALDIREDVKLTYVEKDEVR